MSKLVKRRSLLPEKINKQVAKDDFDLNSFYVVISFAKSPSTSFENALFIAQSADHFATKQISAKKEFYFAGFHHNPKSIAKAVVLLQYCSGWRSTTVFVEGNPRTPAKSWWFLSCYSDSFKAQDKKAYCWGDSPISDMKSFIFVSCKQASHGYLMTKGSHENLIEQFHAKAVDVGCEVCPLFKSDVAYPPEAIEELKIKPPKYWD